MAHRILVVVAHSDDETLGCGATLRRHATDGDEVFALHLTDGIGARLDQDDELTTDRVKSSEAAASILGFKWIQRGTFPDNRLDSIPLLEVVKFIESAKQSIQPDLVYTHNGSDLNIDHRVAFQATLTAFRMLSGEVCTEIRTFEVPSSTEWSDIQIASTFIPELFVCAESTWDAKVQALHSYEKELRAFPHPRSVVGIDALSRFRGMQSGLMRAEAFRTVRRITR